MTHQELFAETVLSQAFLNIFHYKILGFAGRNLLYPNFPYGKFLERLSFAYSTRTCLFFSVKFTISKHNEVLKNIIYLPWQDLQIRTKIKCEVISVSVQTGINRE